MCAVQVLKWCSAGVCAVQCSAGVCVVQCSVEVVQCNASGIYGTYGTYIWDCV